MRLHLALPIFAEAGLDFTRDLERNTGTFSDFDGQVWTFHRSNTTEEAQVLALSALPGIKIRIEAVMDGAHPGHLLKLALEIADRDILEVRIVRIEITEHLFVHMMDRVYHRRRDEPRHGNRRHAVYMNQVAVPDSIFNRPLLFFVQPAFLNPDGGFTVGIHHNFNALLLKSLGQLRHE